MRSSLLIAACVALSLASPVMAQNQPADSMAALRQQVKSDKKQLVAANMDLTPDQATKFWPVYDAYQVELEGLTQRAAKLVQLYADNYRSMTDPVATQILNDYLGMEQDRVALMQAYRPKFAAVIPAVQVARYYQIENKIRAVVLYEVADAIPLIGRQ